MNEDTKTPRTPNRQLRRERQERGWTQQRVADEIQARFPDAAVTGAYVRRWEKGLRKPRPYYQEKLCVIYGKSASQLGLLPPEDEQDPSEPTSELLHEQEEHDGSSTSSPVLPQHKRKPSPAQTSVHPDQPSHDLCTVPTSSPENMVQSEESEQTSQSTHPTSSRKKQDKYYLSDEGIWLPVSTSIQMNALRVAYVGSPFWFVEKQQQWHDLVESYYGRGLLCTELEARLRQEFAGMKPQPGKMDYTISRRQALATLIQLPLLSLPTKSDRKTKIAAEEFLPQCTASISVCWEALNGGELALIEPALSRYLPTLEAWSHHQSRYQKMAAYLGAQGSLLMALISYHGCQFQQGLTYAYQAADLAQISEHRNLYVYALILLGEALHWNGYLEEMLKWHVQATKYSKEVVQPLQSHLFAILAYSYARNGMGTDALENISKARDLFTDDFKDVPQFVSANYGFFELILNEGLTHLELAERDKENRKTHSEAAGKALVEIETSPATLFIPQRSKLQIINQQALAAVWEGNMDDFLRYFHDGVEGAKALGSEKRWQELVMAWRAARVKWPHEDQIAKSSILLLDR